MILYWKTAIIVVIRDTVGGSCVATGRRTLYVSEKPWIHYLKMMNFVLQNDGFCITNDEFCIKHDVFVLKMMDFVLNMMDFVLKKMDFVLKMMNFGRILRSSGMGRTTARYDSFYLKWWILH